MNIEIYYQPFTDSPKHWVCRFGEKDEDFMVGKTPLQAFNNAEPRIREYLKKKKWKN